MPEENRNLYLVDGSGYIFRAFFALPHLNNSRGLPTNATYGFIRMLLKLLKDARPSHIAVVFDSPKRTFRDDLFDSYKANRDEAPNDLVTQIPYIHRAVDAFRIKSITLDGYEADDVIGTLAVQAARAKFNTVIVTGDKDFMQLVGGNITLWDTMRDKRVGPREVRERFGVEPRALVDIMALMGDSIDNVKGVPGVGEKTASALIQLLRLARCDLRRSRSDRGDQGPRREKTRPNVDRPSRRRRACTQTGAHRNRRAARTRTRRSRMGRVSKRQASPTCCANSSSAPC